MREIIIPEQELARLRNGQGWLGSALYYNDSPEYVQIIVRPKKWDNENWGHVWRIWLDGAHQKFPDAKRGTIYNEQGESVAGWVRDA